MKRIIYICLLFLLLTALAADSTVETDRQTDDGYPDKATSVGEEEEEEDSSHLSRQNDSHGDDKTERGDARQEEEKASSNFSGQNDSHGDAKTEPGDASLGSRKLWGSAATPTVTTSVHTPPEPEGPPSAIPPHEGSASTHGHWLGTPPEPEGPAIPPHEGSSSTHGHWLGEENSTTQQQHIPFVASKSTGNHHPPEGYVITARVYIDPHDKLAHFDEESITLPYWDCGVSGSTTSAMPLKNAYFRHSLAATTQWSGTDGMHPVLAVALSPFIMELNSGVSKLFQAGDVVLLEDVLLPGHKMRPVNQDLMVLFFTLPQQHYHPGKEHLSLKSVVSNTKQDPCPEEHSIDDVASMHMEVSSSSSSVESTNGWTARRVRLTVLGIIGMSISTLAADFLGKTAPLWLAVGVGGSCFVAAGTYAFCAGGDQLLTALELWHERRRLNSGDEGSESISEE